MADKKLYLKTLAIVVVVGAPLLLLLGFISDLLSPREWAIGMCAWGVTLLLWASARKRAERDIEPRYELPTVIDDQSRKRILRDILKRKIWIAVLIVLIPVGIVNGITHRALLPTLAGVGISLLLVYVAGREITQRRRRLRFTQK